MASPVHLLTWGESGDGRADRNDRASQIEPGHRVLRLAESEGEAEQVRPARHQMPCTSVQTCRVDAHEDLVVPDLRRADLLKTENVGGAVRVLHDGSHIVFRWHRVVRVAAHRRVLAFRFHRVASSQTVTTWSF